MTGPHVGRELSTTGKAGYGLGMSGLWLIFMTTAYYLFYYFTDVVGLDPRQVGTIFLVSLIWDGITDPFMGWLASRTKSKWGQYRPYILLGTVPVALSFILLFFQPPEWAPGKLFTYGLITALLFRTLFTVVYIPYTAMIARLSRDANERSSIAGFKTSFLAIGALAASYGAFPLVERLGQGDDEKGFFFLAVLFGVIAAVALLISGVVTHEPPREDNAKSRNDSSSLADVWQGLIPNRPFWLAFFGLISFAGCYTLMNKTLPYMMEYDLGDRAQVKWLFSAVAVAGFVSPVFWAWLTHRSGKKFVWISGALLSSIVLLAVYILAPRNITVLAVCFFIIGCGIQAILMTFYAMTADAIDYGEWKTGIRIEAIGFGLMSFANKASLAVGGWMLGHLLADTGYVAKQEQSEATLAGIRQILAFIPISGFLISAVIVLFFPVGNALHGEIRAELDRRANGA
ncbi:MAG: MFS transporter [Hyphomonadaceae bacterium]|nr:MFS transporter [Hyphomonadaceae bacterium]